MAQDASTGYADGLAIGESWAQNDIEQQRGTGSFEIELREEATSAVNAATSERSARRWWAAYRLGIARGYRAVTR